MFLSNEMNSFLQCRDRFSWFELFAEKVILELNAAKSFPLELLDTIQVFVGANEEHKYEKCEATDGSKNFFLVRKVAK